MIIIGGVDPSNDTIFSGSADSGSEPVDPWPEGIGIFDMTALKFKDSYEANAKQYETPELIKQFYNDTSVNSTPRPWHYIGITNILQEQSVSSNLELTGGQGTIPNAIQSNLKCF